jgi:hypothetical protein
MGGLDAIFLIFFTIKATIHCEMAPPMPLYMGLEGIALQKIQRDYKGGVSLEWLSNAL